MKTAEDTANALRRKGCLHGARKAQFCQACLTDFITVVQGDVLESCARESEMMAAKYETGATFDERAAEVCIVVANRLRALAPAATTEEK